MNKHYEISCKKLIKLDKEQKPKSRGNASSEEEMDKCAWLKKVSIFTNKKMLIYFHSDEIKEAEHYYIINRKKKKWTNIYKINVEPKSVREKLHNIQENKKFYANKK